MKNERVERLVKADNEYYLKGVSFLSDAEYDAEKEELRKNDPDNPYLNKVGVGVFREAVSLPLPMQSICNVFTQQALTDWLQGVLRQATTKEVLVSIEPKVDGVAGVVWRTPSGLHVATRGDQDTGESVTLTAGHLFPSDVVQRIRDPVVGEFYVPVDTFQPYTGMYASPRSMAVGLLKRESSTAARDGGLCFIQHGGPPVDGIVQIPRRIETLSLSTIDHIVECVSMAYDTAYQYIIDGIVVKVQDVSLRQRMGTTAAYPRWVRAYKRNLDTGSATIHNLVWQIGRTGVLTPVVEFTPVILGGHTISKATLHNDTFVQRYAVGDIVRVGRAGGVIPEVVCVETPSGNPSLQSPDKCPECGHAVLRKYSDNIGGDIISCGNSDCTGRVVARLLYECGVLKLKGFGEATLRKIVEISEGSVKTVFDLWRVDYNYLNSIIGATAYSLVGELIDCKLRGVELHQFLTLLQMPLIAEEVSRKLAENYSTFRELMLASKETLIDLIGPVKGSTVYTELRSDIILSYYVPAVVRTVKVINTLIDKPDTEAAPRKRFSGQRFHITGKFPVPRQKIESFIRVNGGTITSTLSDDVLLLVGDSPTTRKVSQARHRINFEDLHYGQI